MALVPHAVEVLPDDEHNARLLAHAHPRDWHNPVPRHPYNLVVVGAGPAGLIAAAGAAGLGARVALVERHLMGGDCLNYGCVPSKALLRCATAWADVRDARRYGVSYGGELRVDFGAVMARLRRLRADLSAHDAVQRFTELGVDVFLGHGCFTAPRRLAVDGQFLTFARAVIATGSHAGVPPIPGLAETPMSQGWGSRRLGSPTTSALGCRWTRVCARPMRASLPLVMSARAISSPMLPMHWHAPCWPTPCSWGARRRQH